MITIYEALTCKYDLREPGDVLALTAVLRTAFGDALAFASALAFGSATTGTFLVILRLFGLNFGLALALAFDCDIRPAAWSKLEVLEAL